MATVGPSSASTGPRYAPEDPSLPKPWLGLIDGSTGLLYYWNPETNITQYEKPASLPPPLPPGPPPTASTPKLAQLPVANSVQPNGLVAQATQQITQAMLQQGQQVSQSPLQHGQAMAQYQASSVAQVSNLQGAQQQGSQLGQTMQQPGQLRPQMMQHPGQQMLSYIGQQMPQQGGQQLAQHPGQPIQQQAIQQMPPHQSMQMPPPHGQQYIYQQTHYMAYQQSILQHGQQNSQQQNQLSAQGLQFPNQNEYKAGPPKREEGDFEQANQTGSSPAHFQQAGASSLHNLPAGSTPVSAGIHAGQAQQFGGSAPNMKQPSSVVQLQSDIGHQQHGSRLPNQMGASAMHSQQSTAPPVGLNIGYERNVHGMGGSDYYFSPKLEGPAMTPSQPNLAAIPMARNQQESRMGGVPFKDVTPGYASGFNSAGHSMNNTYSHAPAGPPFLNNAFVRPPFTGTSDISNLSPAEVYCQEHEVTATGDNIPPPFMTFESTGFPVEILRDIHSAGFLSPTPIQAQTWPIALQNRDIVAIAKTGSGKTLGYLIPAFILIRKRRNNPQNGPTVLVLAPTRELATQIQDEAIKFGHSSRVSCTCLYGGAPKGPQLKELDRGADIVVATPGRLNDVLEMKKVNFQQVSLFVLDEADRMLDMGFEPQIRKIVNEMPPRRQTLMYTATWPKEVRKIASDLLFNPVQVNIGSVDELAANKSITQYVEVVPQMEKDRRLEQILRAQERGSKVIIFCSTKKLCDQLARSIGRKFGATAIHGDKSQAERDWVLNQFRSGKSPVLVATDVAARGLDIKDIRVVINYDFPTGIEDYVHRIGRTGRAGATGVSYTFFSEQDSKYAVDLIKVLEGANQHVPSEIRDIALRGGPIVGKDRGMVNHFDSAPAGSGRWESSGRGGMRDGFGARGGMRDGFWGRGGMRDGGFGGRGGMRDGSFTGRGGMRDVGFGARGGMRDGPFNSRGGRNDSFSGRGNRGRGFSGPIGGNGSWDRNERGPHDRYNYMDSRGRGRGRGRGRFDGRRNNTDRGRGRSYSRSPERFRTWGYSRSKSKSRSRSRSQSRSWSRDRSRSYSRSPRRGRSYSRSPRRSRSYSRSPRRSRSYSHSPRRSRSYSRSPRRSRSYSRSPQRSRSYSRSPQHGHGHGHSHSSRNDRFGSPNDKSCIEKNAAVPEVKASGPGMSPMSPGTHGDAFSGAEQVTAVVNAESTLLEAPADQSLQSVQET